MRTSQLVCRHAVSFLKNNAWGSSTFAQVRENVSEHGGG